MTQLLNKEQKDKHFKLFQGRLRIARKDDSNNSFG